MTDDRTGNGVIGDPTENKTDAVTEVRGIPSRPADATYWHNSLARP